MSDKRKTERLKGKFVATVSEKFGIGAKNYLLVKGEPFVVEDDVDDNALRVLLEGGFVAKADE